MATNGIPSIEKNSIEKNSIEKIIIVYEEEIGNITPYQLEKLESYLDDLSEEMIIEAIYRTSKMNKKSLSYIEGILKNWIRDGYKTLGDIKDTKNKNDDTKSRIDEIWED